jgi:hypothetical protein
MDKKVQVKVRIQLVLINLSIEVGSFPAPRRLCSGTEKKAVEANTTDIPDN